MILRYSAHSITVEALRSTDSMRTMTISSIQGVTNKGVTNKGRAPTLSFFLIALLCQVVNAGGQTAAIGQSPVVTVTLDQDQIASVKTARGITTRLVFAERVQEIICGDLYDPATGVGTFVIQRVGNDVFLKPIVSEGVSNLFVKAGENSEVTYSFDLLIGSAQQAFRIVRVVPKSSTPETKQAKATSRLFLRPPVFRVVDVVFQGPHETPAGLSETVKLVQQLPPPPPPIPASSASAVTTIKSAREVAASQRTKPRNAVRTLKPEYPDVARRVGADGEVAVQVLIDEKGNVASAKALSGNPLLRSAAVAAARMWKFEPVGRGNRSTDSQTITFNFILASSDARGQKNEDRQ